MHGAIGLTMGVYLFALVMIILNLAGFGIGIRATEPCDVQRLRPDETVLNPRFFEKFSFFLELRPANPGELLRR